MTLAVADFANQRPCLGRRDWVSSMRTKAESHEFLVFVLLFAAMTVVVTPLLVPPGAPLIALMLVETLLFSVALDFAELITATLSADSDLLQLDALDDPPRVAVLYLVCDDAVPEAVGCLLDHGYRRADVFVLDDSVDDAHRRLLDATGLTVVRRAGRSGAKAGSINNWVRRYGSSFRYFLVLDSDSIVPNGFVDSIVRYAEHPSNARVAIFNTLATCWNVESRFSRTLSAMWPLRNWIRMRLANRASCVLSSGHNNLHRTEAIASVGGFDEAFVAEDIAITLRLLRKGYTSRLVKLYAFESEPENVVAYARRLVRWAMQTVQIQRADWRGMPFSLRFQMFKLWWPYATFLFSSLWIVAAAWGMRSSPSDASRLLQLLAERDGVLPMCCRVLAFPAIVFLIRIPFLPRAGLSLARYAENCGLSLAIAFYLLPRMCIAQLAAAVAREFTFEVTDKRPGAITLGTILHHERHSAAFWAFIAFGFAQNVSGAVLLAPWLAMIALSPLVIRWFHEAKSERFP